MNISCRNDHSSLSHALPEGFTWDHKGSRGEELEGMCGQKGSQGITGAFRRTNPRGVCIHAFQCNFNIVYYISQSQFIIMQHNSSELEDGNSCQDRRSV